MSGEEGAGFLTSFETTQRDKDEMTQRIKVEKT